MNPVKAITAVTMGRPERVRPMLLWTTCEYLLRGAPYGILLMVVLELFKPLEDPAAVLDVNAVVRWCLVLFVLLMLLYLVGRNAYFSSFKGSYEICADGRLSIVEHLRRQPMGFFTTRDPGDIGAYIVNDYSNAENLLSHHLPHLCGAVAAPLVLLGFLATMNWKLALAAALVIPLSFPATWISLKIIRYFGVKHQRYKVQAAARMIEYIQGIRLIKAFNLDDAGFERLEQSFGRLRTESIRLEGGSGPTVILSSFVLNSGFPLIILFGATLLTAGEVSLPVYVVFLLLGARVYEPLTHALIFLAEGYYFSLGVERIDDLRNSQPLLEGNRVTVAHHEVELRGVSFRYQDVEVLKEVSLRIPARSLTALVGPSGSGKTTLTRLIARFWDVETGEILIGGHNIKEFSGDFLLEQIAIVFQDVYLFNDTILNNIRIGRPDASHEQIEAAARAACCHDFIEALPEGYATLVGEGGSTLSGGEKQRISIARAILKDAPIVLLDEATASLDPENELHIQTAINELVKDRTLVVIAHRLNTICRADKIIVMDQGRVAEEGRHEELLERGGLYRNLWNEQQKIKGWKF